MESNLFSDLRLKTKEQVLKIMQVNNPKFEQLCKDTFEDVLDGLEGYIQGCAQSAFDMLGRNRGTLVKGMVVSFIHPETGKTAVWNVKMVNQSRALVQEIAGEFKYSIAPTAAVTVLYTPEPEPVVTPLLPKIIQDELDIINTRMRDTLTDEQIQKAKEWFANKNKPRQVPDDIGI